MLMTLPLRGPIYFGPFLVTPQVFHLTSLSFALVNLRPLLPGHVLISPLRVCPRISQLSPAETADLFITARRVGKMLERVYGATAFNFAVQDGVGAGQSVPHVHVHVIPRKERDMEEKGGGDALYGLLEGKEGDVGEALWLEKRRREQEGKRFEAKTDGERLDRSEEEMVQEAERLRMEMNRESEEEEEG